eukprot:6592275-Pyramimonas_sp.AAC.1
MVAGGKAYEAESKQMRADAELCTAVDWKSWGPTFLHISIPLCIYIAEKESKMQDPQPHDQEQHRISEQIKQLIDDRMKS